MKFKRGQIVRIKRGYTTEPIWVIDMDITIGKTGPILYNKNVVYGNCYFVGFENGHTRCIKGKYLKGWWYKSYMLEPFNRQQFLFPYLSDED